MFDIIGKKWYFISLSVAIILCGIIFAGVRGVPWGIDFTGGTVLTVQFEKAVSHDSVKSELAGVGHDEAIIQDSGEDAFIIRTEELSELEQDELMETLSQLATIEEHSFDSVSDPVSKEKARGAVIAVVIAAIGILLYIAFAFRKLPKPFRYGTCAVIALIHDVAIAVAIFAIVGGSLNLKIDLMFITGLLTVVGYSVNDTIVVFDRIRENLGKSGRQRFEIIVNNSLIETLTRSLATSLTTLIVLVSVYLFVGEAIESFMLVLIVGVISGTYSSIFIASQALVLWETGSLRKLFRRTA